MAEQIVSPGVFTRENDQSFIATQPVTVGASIVGPTVLGPVGIPTVVTSYSDYLNRFGSTFLSASAVYTYFTSIAAYNYFNNGGQSLLVTRVTTGSFTSALSKTNGGANYISSSVASGSFQLETLSAGIIMNTTSSEDASGSLASGSKDNIRWEISQTDTASGTFTLLIRQGNDTINQKSVLETWAGLSLDPKAPNYISKIIGDQTQTVVTSGGSTYLQVTGSYPNKSRWVRVSDVPGKTPDYFDNTGLAKSQYVGFIPGLGSGSFATATGTLFVGGPANFYQNINNTNTQGLIADNYTQSLALLANKDDYQYNVMIAPGLVRDASNFASHIAPINVVINNASNRGDNIAVIDVAKYNETVSNVVSKASAVDSSYAATYWPWLQTIDPDTGELVWVPASTMIPSIYAFNDSISEPWFAPAGLNRGALSTVVRAERKLPQGDRDTLYSGKVNPIATFPNTGTVVYGQKTLQTKASALDRVNVRRLLIALKGYISGVSQNLVFEQNTIATRNQFLSQINPYLESVQQRQGLYAFKVVMDDSNNTPDVIDRNQLVGQIYLQPTKTAEFIILDFNILPTGATFS